MDIERQSETNLRIQREEEMDPATKERYVEILGPPRQRRRALELIMNLASFVREDSGKVLRDDRTSGGGGGCGGCGCGGCGGCPPHGTGLKIWVWSREAGRIIGRGGETVREIMNRTGTEVQVQRSDGQEHGNAERMITIIGAKPQQNEALAMILRDISFCRGELGVIKSPEMGPGGPGGGLGAGPGCGPGGGPGAVPGAPVSAPAQWQGMPAGPGMMPPHGAMGIPPGMMAGMGMPESGTGPPGCNGGMHPLGMGPPLGMMGMPPGMHPCMGGKSARGCSPSSSSSSSSGKDKKTSKGPGSNGMRGICGAADSVPHMMGMPCTPGKQGTPGIPGMDGMPSTAAPANYDCAAPWKDSKSIEWDEL